MRKEKETMTWFICDYCETKHPTKVLALTCEEKCKAKRKKPHKDRDTILAILTAYCPDLEVGSWRCDKSFYGKCIQIDEGYDEVCIFCGEPEERK